MVPCRIDEKFRLYHFVPYSKLLPDEFNKFESDTQEFVINASGGLTEKGSDLSKEYTLSSLDWMNAANRAVVRTRYWHGDVGANPLQHHHEFVAQIGRSHGWSIALEYDVQQRKLAEANINHDLVAHNMNLLILLASKPVHIASSYHVPMPSPSKHKFTESTGQMERHNKRTKSEWFRCFRCGKPRHFPTQCHADKTIAGKVPFQLSPTPKNENCIVSPEGKPLCIRWARTSNCHFGSSCSATHMCSWCGDTGHGNMCCPAAGP